jgi:23S rRNA (cytosine1962-C5)-methyltransferase
MRAATGANSLCVLFEDEHLLVVNKPPGWNTHAPSPFAGEGIYDWLRHREPRWASLAIVHRLDKETSGVMVFTKTAVANKSLTQQFERGEVQKCYVLVTDRPMKGSSFTVRSHLVRSGDRYVSKATGSPRDFAETTFKAIRSEDGRTWLEARPRTGRTHQIRVHAMERGIPIVGDALYGGAPAQRVWLHAAEMSFRHPRSNDLITVRAKPDFECPRHFALRSAFVDRCTDAFRLVHGAADGHRGWFVDKLGPNLLSSSEDPLNRARTGLLREWAVAMGLSAAYHKALRRHVGAAHSKEASAQLVHGEAAPGCFEISENAVKFEAAFDEGYSVGLFLDQRDNRRRILSSHVAAGFDLSPHAQHFALNCFAYTCAFSVCAALAGAHTTSIDLSRKYLDWGRRNFALNGLDSDAHEFLHGDCFDWMRRLAKKGRAFDLVLLDPPTFSRSKQRTFSAVKDYGALVSLAMPLVKPRGVLFASTNAATIEPENFLAMVRRAVEASGRRIAQEFYAPQPPDFPITREEPAHLKTVWLLFA